jgi:preprotein translocase subunit SecG
MTTILLVIHLLVTVFLIGIILIQRAEGGALGMGGGSGMGLMNARGQANFLTRTTRYLGIAFFATSIALAFISTNHTTRNSIVDDIANTAPAAETPAQPVEAPSAPLPK